MSSPSKRQRTASSCSSSSTCTTHDHQSWTYDVFLSFRGADTRNNFVGHLHAYLVRKGIKTFIDDEEFERGDGISHALQKAIQESKISIVVFSENYASSKWCLEELVKILHCRKTKQQLVYPVFYKVDPSDVRRHRGSFGKALAHHESRLTHNLEKVKRWREALTKASNLSGWHFIDGSHESNFIDAIVEGISAQLLDRKNTANTGNITSLDKGPLMVDNGSPSVMQQNKDEDVSMIEVFNGSFFKRWQERVFSALDGMNYADYLTKAKPEEGSEDYDNAVAKWEKGNNVCRHTILSTLSSELFDIYCTYKTAAEIWEVLNKKYVAEDAGSQKHAIGNFLEFQMIEDKDVLLQIHEFHKSINDLKTEGIELPEAFVSGSLIEKLPESWKDDKNNMKHKTKHMSLEDVVHICIEETNRVRDKAELAEEMKVKANVIEEAAGTANITSLDKEPLMVDNGSPSVMQQNKDKEAAGTGNITSLDRATTHDHQSRIYDVFLSFRGADTRHNFVGHLHAALVRKGIKTFIDDEKLGGGDEISHVFQKAIQESKISVIVFSENYASSRWCLEELVCILHCKESKQQLVYPVFYNVDPADVRHQRGSFAEALAHHESRLTHNLEKVKRWREALTKASNLSGWHFIDGSHGSNFIDTIAEGISAQLLDHIHLNVAKEPLMVDNGSPSVMQQNKDKAAGTGNITSLDKEPLMVDNGSPSVMQQNKDEGCGAEEDSDLEKTETFEFGCSFDYLKDLNNFEAEGDSYGYCANCVPDEICKTCGNKNGIP